jgi:hypothetical protein
MAKVLTVNRVVKKVNTFTRVAAELVSADSDAVLVHRDAQSFSLRE